MQSVDAPSSKRSRSRKERLVATCPACCDPYDASLPPMAFPCLHVVCRECVSSRELADELACPVCRRGDGPPALDADFLAAIEPGAELRLEPTDTARVVAAECRRVAATLAARGDAIAAEKATMDAEADAACHKFTRSVDAFIAQLAEHRYQKLAAMKAITRARAKALDAEADEMAVSAAQLEVRAAMVEAGRCPARDAVRISSAFSAAGRRTLPRLRPQADFVVDTAAFFADATGDVEEVAEVREFSV